MKNLGRALMVLVAICFVLFLCSLIGCTSFTPTNIVKVPVPVACQETEPDRPTMPTDSLRPGGTLFDAVTSMQAEIEIRGGYEGRLVTALRACIKPVAPS